MFTLFEYSLKIFLYFWIGAFGIGFADMALKLHDETAMVYRRGPISASTFTRMMTGNDYKGRPLYVNDLAASKRSRK